MIRAVSPSLTLHGCRRRADELWVGWEFIADPVEVARSCERGDIADIGPGSDVIRLLGDKTRVRQLSRCLTLRPVRDIR
jgi:pyruvate carboxylase